jgi:adenine-specific DNA-methyltransferase
MPSVFYSYAQTATLDFVELMGNRVFENPKNWKDLKRLFAYLSGPNDIIMDFFAGSCSSAHAVLDLNAEGNSQRRYIMVQIPENCDESTLAYTKGFRTITDIGKARIKKCAQSYNCVGDLLTRKLDLGFRVLKIDTSNMKDVYYSPDAVKQADLMGHTDNIKEDRTPEDLVFQVLVDWGVDLALPIERRKIADKTVFFVDGNALAACFDLKISEDLVKELAKGKPLRAVFRDNSYDSDSTKINVEQIFKLLSPETEVKSL